MLSWRVFLCVFYDNYRLWTARTDHCHHRLSVLHTVVGILWWVWAVHAHFFMEKSSRTLSYSTIEGWVTVNATILRRWLAPNPSILTMLIQSAPCRFLLSCSDMYDGPPFACFHGTVFFRPQGEGGYPCAKKGAPRPFRRTSHVLKMSPYWARFYTTVPPL